MLNVLSKVIDYRTEIKNIMHYEQTGDFPNIVKNAISFIYKTVLFDNLYYEDAT